MDYQATTKQMVDDLTNNYSPERASQLVEACGKSIALIASGFAHQSDEDHFLDTVFAAIVAGAMQYRMQKTMHVVNGNTFVPEVQNGLPN